MGCQEIRQQLATYRELSADERDRLQEHLATCPSCAATLATYRAQDQLLSAMPLLAPSPALIEAVHARTTGRHPKALSFSWQRAMAALALLLCFSAAWGTVSRASAALPGDFLYPIKRGAEAVRLSLTFDPVAREQYQERLAETRRQEVGAVIELGHAARVEFQGYLLALGADVWQVDGFAVTVGTEAWAGTPPPIGSIIEVQALAANGRLTAGQMRVLQRGVATPQPQVSPAGPLSPSRTPTTRQHSSESTATPGAWGPGPQPSVTPGTWGPGPQPSVTPGTWRPEPQPSTTPGKPEKEPSATPGMWGPGPQPSATAATSGPGPQPSATPTAPGPGQQPSLTPATRGPGPQPSVTSGRP